VSFIGNWDRLIIKDKEIGCKKMKKNKWILPSIMVLLLIIITIGVTFAAFTFSKEGTVENTLETGTVTLTYTEGKTGIMLNEAYPMSDERGKMLTGENNVFDFTVQANLSRTMSIGYEVTAVKIPITDMTPLLDNEVKLYLERAVDPDTTYSEIFAPSNFIPREEQTEIGSPVGSMILDSGNFTQAGTTIHHYRLRLWVDENTQIPNGEARKYGIKINVYAKQDIFATPEPPKNKNISNIWKYDETTNSSTFCVTGEEVTCKEIEAPETYEPGTIIKYKVNPTTEKYFHVISDDGDTLTLQQRENTVAEVMWYAESKDSRKGPITVLPMLEETTKDWVNVLDQTYTLGTTVFKDNAFTGCKKDDTTYVYSCTTNTYTLGERTAKARMLSMQEALSLGCNSSFQSCPVWMYNYLSSSTNYGGTVNEGKGYAYWLMNAYYPYTYACHLNYLGTLSGSATTVTQGARAVVKIKK